MKTTSCTGYAFDNAPRCGARTKRNNGNPCRSPAVRGKVRCRIHGGSKGSGGQKENTNALTHGETTANMKKFRKIARRLIQANKELYKEFG